VKFTTTFFAICAAATLALVGCSSSPDADNAGADGGITDSLRITTDGTMGAAAIHLGVEQGFFEDVGLTLEITDSPNPPAAIAALQSNEVDIAAVPTVPSLNAQAQGIELISIAPAQGYPEDSDAWADFDTSGVYANPDSNINSPKDLEGKTVAVNARKAVFEAYIQDAVKNDGGDPDQINWVALDFGSQIEALRTGEIDVAGFGMPFNLEAEANGAEMVWAPGASFFEGGVNSTWLASGESIENTDAIDRFREALLKSNEYANENLDEAIEMGAELRDIDVDLIEDSGRFIYFPTELPAEDIEVVSQKLVNLGFLEDTVDMTDRVVFEN